ncbi:hypothetical protein BKA66DRAFT_427084 [Pyrenochaeta sp. MPI-SDFR-AT-0127]|nr:hypothetical protein BKA66DRAFT_427084 [Pyrenochaeta sp. MPI-SDFR-AT-0127]
MSSPAAEMGGAKGGKEPILFRFCSECSNLLFPREDKSENKLLFACRTCSFTEEAPSSCVMRHEIASTVGATAGVTAEVAQDPTVGLSHSTSQASLSDEFPCCTMCGMPIMCVECGEESAPGFMLEAEDEHPPADTQQESFEDYEDFDEDFDDDLDEDMEDHDEDIRANTS